MAVRDWQKVWEMLRQASHILLALDYDGTLAPFQADRMQAVPLPGIAPLLQDIKNNSKTTLAILSGRPVKELKTLLGEPAVILVGSHGWEIMSADGVWRSFLVADHHKKVLELASRRHSDRGLGFFIEKKIASVAFHTRQAPASLVAAAEEEVFQYWTDLAKRHGLECRRFDGGVELRCPERHKGTALGEIMKGQAAGTLAVYLGDDDTDEDAFRSLKDTGIGIKVGSGEEATHASLFLADCTEVRWFLGQFLSAVG